MGQPNNSLFNKAHLWPEARSGPLVVRPIFGPNYGPVTFGLLEAHVDMGPFQPGVSFGLGMARAAHGPYMVRRDIRPTNGM